VAREDVELVSHWETLLPPGTDLKVALGDDATLARAAEILDPEAEIRFVDTEGGALGDFEVPSRGVEGLLAGWAEWLGAWEHFRIDLEEHLDAGDGRVLTLAKLTGQTREGLELSQPGAAIIRVSGARIVAMDFYVDREQARRDAGLS
jgi:ketosteroid isomerase-like protein